LPTRARGKFPGITLEVPNRKAVYAPHVRRRGRRGVASCR
jgi:hypothetical protein